MTYKSMLLSGLASLIMLPLALVAFCVIVAWGIGMALCMLAAWALGYVGEHVEDFE